MAKILHFFEYCAFMLFLLLAWVWLGDTDLLHDPTIELDEHEEETYHEKRA